MALKPLNSVAGFSVGETPANIILANGDITTTNITTTGVSNLNSIGNVKISGGSSGQVISTDGTGNLSYISIDSAALNNGNSNVRVFANSNVTVSVGGTANVATFTSTGINVAGYVSAGNITANGNLSVNNYIVTASTKDLIVAPDTQITRFYSNVNPFSGGYSLGNALARWDNVFANTANVSGNVSAGNVLTDHLLYANGQPWDLQEAAGSNNEIQFNDNDNFGASANFTFNPSTNLLTVNGNAQFNNANLGNLAIANFVNVASNVTTSNLSVNLGLSGNTANFSGNVIVPNLTVNLELAGNTANFTGNIKVLNANLGNLATANFINVSSNIQVTDTANVGNLRTDHLLYANGQPWDLQEAAGSNTQVQYNDNNDFGASANFTYDEASSNLTVIGNIIANSFFGNISGNLTAPGSNTEIIFNDANVAGAVANFTYDKAYNSGGGELNVGNTVGGQIITDNVYASYGNIGNLDVVTDITAGGNITTTGSGGDITMTGGNITGVNNISANSANFTGNISAANIVGALANGTSNVKVFNDANVEISIGGSANTATFSSTGLYVDGEINTTAGNMLSNGNITANGFLNSANANVTGEAELGSVKTANITAPTGTITISAAGSNQNIILAPSGSGNVDVGLHNITQLAFPVNPNDAATKEYVDNISQGLYIHPSANVTSLTNLNATYNNGGTALTATTISGGKTITFSANHGLSVDSDIEFTNSFNGIIAGEGYYVYSVPAANQITIKDGYFGAEITTLTNGTGLTQAAIGEAGVGATLTNAGAQVALTVDSILMTTGARVLVQGQTDQTENGVYEVTTVGNGSTNWVLTRASDANSYAPKSDTELGAGSYFFITQGTQYAGSSYVLTAPPGEIHFGTSNIVFSQFSKAGSYTAGNGINITGTIISANVDLETTDIVGGNIVVKTSANLTTPNLGDATFSSLSWNNLSNGNVTANNLSIGNIANITGNLRVDGIIQANGNIASNAYIIGNNATFTNFANIGGNLLANNITSNNAFSTNTANISSNLITSNATVNLALSGNTANFSGNVIVNNLTVNLELAGNTANFTGNIKTLNANLGNLVTANYANFTNDVVVQGNIANANNISVTNLINGNTANFSGNVISANIKSNSSVIIGNTSITWGNTTTSAITANQTISSYTLTGSGVTGVEWIVKGVDNNGVTPKYSVATVQAVTDGTSVDYTLYGTVNLGGTTGMLAVNVVGSTLRLQVTPSSSNTTTWITQYRTI